MSALQKCSCQPWEPDCAFLRACCRGRCAHSPAATGPDTHHGERLIPHHGCPGELSPRQSRGVGACQTPALPRSGCCTPRCSGSCATVGHGGGKRWQHRVLLWGWTRWQLSPTHCLCELPGWPPRAGCWAGGHTDSITRVVEGAERGLCHIEAELLCETCQAVVKVFQIRFAQSIHVQCYRPSMSHLILPPPLHHSSAHFPILPVT